MDERFGERGQRLWDAYSALVDARGEVLLDEACRIADRLDKLDVILRGDVDVWARVRGPRFEGDDTVLVIDGALSEARQQANILRQLVAALPVKESGDGDADAWLDDV